MVFEKNPTFAHVKQKEIKTVSIKKKVHKAITTVPEGT